MKKDKIPAYLNTLIDLLAKTAIEAGINIKIAAYTDGYAYAEMGQKHDIVRYTDGSHDLRYRPVEKKEWINYKNIEEMKL